MADKCLSTVGRGFLLAFATGCCVGILRMLFTSGITEEISNRGAPNVVDLAIAFVSGMLAAYAFGRPHLLSVLPGIAIASSLVPPVAASALSLMAFNLDVAMGATLLFLSNFVAIVLGATFALWVVGMRGPREVNPFTEWAQLWMLGFFGIAVCLAVFFTIKSDNSQLRAASVTLEGKQFVLSAAESKPDNPSTAHGEPKAPKSPSSLPDESTKQPDDAVDTKVQVVLKPVVEAAPQEGGQSPGPSVTVVIPRESRADGPDTSVQIEGLASEDVAELLEEVLNDVREPNRSESAMLVIIAIGLVGLGYLGWRHRRRP